MVVYLRVRATFVNGLTELRNTSVKLTCTTPQHCIKAAHRLVAAAKVRIESQGSPCQNLHQDSILLAHFSFTLKMFNGPHSSAISGWYKTSVTAAVPRDWVPSQNYSRPNQPPGCYIAALPTYRQATIQTWLRCWVSMDTSTTELRDWGTGFNSVSGYNRSWRSALWLSSVTQNEHRIILTFANDSFLPDTFQLIIYQSWAPPCHGSGG